MGEEKKKEKRSGRKENEGKKREGREEGRMDRWADSLSPFQLFCVILFYGD